MVYSSTVCTYCNKYGCLMESSDNIPSSHIDPLLQHLAYALTSNQQSIEPISSGQIPTNSLWVLSMIVYRSPNNSLQTHHDPVDRRIFFKLTILGTITLLMLYYNALIFVLTFLGRWVCCTVEYFHSAQHHAHYVTGTIQYRVHTNNIWYCTR